MPYMPEGDAAFRKAMAFASRCRRLASCLCMSVLSNEGVSEKPKKVDIVYALSCTMEASLLWCVCAVSEGISSLEMFDDRDLGEVADRM